MSETIRLYTRQSEKTLLMLEHNGRIVNNRVYVQLHFGDMAQHYLDCYDWFAEQAARRVPKCEGAEMPLWCATRPEDCLPPIPGTVVYVVEKPREQVVFFDDADWDYVLNHRYLPLNDEDERAYRRHVRELGLNSTYEFFEGRYANLYPDEMQRVRESWTRLFDIWKPESHTLCGNIWSIEGHELVRIVHPGERVTE